MINIAGKLISNKVNNIRFFLNYPKIDIEEENDHVQKFVELVNKSIKNEVDIFEEIVINTYFEENIIGNVNAISEARKYLEIVFYSYLQLEQYCCRCFYSYSNNRKKQHRLHT